MSSHPKTNLALARIEKAVARVLRRTYGVAIEPHVAPWLAAGDAAGAREALAHIVQTGYLSPAAANLTRDLRGYVERLAYVGAVDISHQVGTALRGTGHRLSEVMPPTARIVAADADLYQRAAVNIVHAHVKASAEGVSEAILRGINRGDTARDIGKVIHSLPVRVPVKDVDGQVVGHRESLLRQWADTWARTETTRYYNLGRVRAGDAAGDYLWGYCYDVIQDDATTDECMALVGVLVPKEDDAQDPPFHWNCRTEKKAVMSSEVGGPDSIDAYEVAGEVKDFPDRWQPDEGFGGPVLDQIARAA